MRKVLYILGQLDDTDVEWLATNGQRQKLAKGSVLIQNGVRSENLYIVIDGRLAVVLPNGFDWPKLASAKSSVKSRWSFPVRRRHRSWWKRIAWCSRFRN